MAPGHYTECFFRDEATALYTYFAAILRVTGMERGESYPLKKVFSNFSGHIKVGRIEKVGTDYRLTGHGVDYFADRYRPGSPQHVDEAEVDAMARMIRSGPTDEWEPVDN